MLLTSSVALSIVHLKLGETSSDFEQLIRDWPVRDMTLVFVHISGNIIFEYPAIEKRPNSAMTLY